MRALLVATTVLVLASCAPQATQIVLVVDSDLTLTNVAIDVSSTNSAPTHATADFSMPATPRLPLTLGIYPRASADIDVIITVRGTLADTTVIERDVQTRFVSGSSRMLRVLLAARCLNQTCSAGQTCDETGCRAIDIGGDALPPWTGSAPSLDGMAACASIDEICNGIDDDCDMHVDEAFHLASDAMNCGVCGHACASGACSNGFCSGEQITSLATGGAHTCAASMAGGLTCWGWNDQDQLGEENYEDVPFPQAVAGASNIASVAAGGLHTCTIDHGGRCGCFGDGQDGQLGRGTMLDSAMLAPVAGAGTAASVLAGIGTTCTLDAGGTLSCWGANGSGQIGVGGTMSLATPGTMVMANVASASLGFEHGCAVTTSHQLWCWGSNTTGQRGTGMVTMAGRPVQVPGVTDAIAVACGRTFTCFVRMAGDVACFGANDLGQLGNGTNVDSTTPVAVSTITGATAISAASGGTHVCALRSGGLVACWGGNQSGQLGDGTVTSRNAPVMITMPTDVTAIATGGIAPDGTGHTCALDHEGRVWCWGDNSLGQLATYDTMNRSLPTLVLGAM